MHSPTSIDVVGPPTENVLAAWHYLCTAARLSPDTRRQNNKHVRRATDLLLGRRRES